MSIQPAETFAALGDESFIALTTFRKSGIAVTTTVWVARDDDALLVLTPGESGKVKRLRNSNAVQLQPCSRRGDIIDDAVRLFGTAEIVSDAADVERLRSAFQAKYGFEYKVTMVIERILAKRQKPRVVLRVTPGVSPQGNISP